MQLPVTTNDRAKSEIASDLKRLGYTNIDDVRLSGDIYTAWVLWNGEPAAILIDDKTGHSQFTSSSDTETVPSRVDWSESGMICALEGPSYTNVNNMMKAGDIFRATAMREGMSYQLRVNAETGVMTNSAEGTDPTVGMASSMSGTEIVIELAKMGYKDGKVDGREGNVTSVQAKHMGKNVDLNIDSRTGTVTVVNCEVRREVFSFSIKAASLASFKSINRNGGCCWAVELWSALSAVHQIPSLSSAGGGCDERQSAFGLGEAL